MDVFFSRAEVACADELRRIARQLDGVLVAALLDIRAGSTRAAFVDPASSHLADSCTAMAVILGEHVHASTCSEPLNLLTMQTAQHVHVVRPLSHVSSLALYVIALASKVKSWRVRLAVEDAAFVLDHLHQRR